MRRTVKPSVDRRVFHHTAMRTKLLNTNRVHYRGGIRL